MKIPNKNTLVLLSAFFIAINSPYSFSQSTDNKRSPVSPLEWSDKNELKRKADNIDRLGRRYFGKGLSGTTADIDLLQRIADKKIIKKSDTKNLQATGVALGNILKNELSLNWVVYQDKYGRSRALCVPQTEHCLFPTTMLSRHLEIGAPVNVFETYQKAVKLIDPYIPDTNAYDGKKPDPTPKASWLNNRKEKSKNIPIR
ncbi:MAG: DUF3806 domain-containing protein [Cellvibrionaceae bacterium]